ncbi:hypothetical protein ACFXDH_35255 [Streptomyces sp. NPDC059467]|uniref:hypothetical protein n=1 Tax=Streptomyces sp. NPDC059467 TaxID=3346844 RepID=UPI003694444D
MHAVGYAAETHGRRTEIVRLEPHRTQHGHRPDPFTQVVLDALLPLGAAWSPRCGRDASRIIVRDFTPPSDTIVSIPGSGTELPAMYVHQCHLPEHEDGDMMRPWTIVRSNHR